MLFLPARGPKQAVGEESDDDDNEEGHDDDDNADGEGRVVLMKETRVQDLFLIQEDITLNGILLIIRKNHDK